METPVPLAASPAELGGQLFTYRLVPAHRESTSVMSIETLS